MRAMGLLQSWKTVSLVQKGANRRIVLLKGWKMVF